MGNKLIFQKLTPCEDVELGTYENALDYIFSQNDIKNIAISGSYGAGKSSIMAAYEKKHEERKFLHISLAHFKDVQRQEEKSGNGLEQDLEGKIINQLVYQIPVDKIPQTKFNIKRNSAGPNVRESVINIVIICIAVLILIFHDEWYNIVQGVSIDALRHLFYFTATREMQIMSVVVLICCIGIEGYKILKNQIGKGLIHKINLKGKNVDIELFGDEDDSYFDKYLNEILYLFENTEADAIVFEDIDRYDTTLIFEKLREINTLLNQRKEINDEEKYPIRFIYLLRDNIFETQDRTKFFDFILPIVPVIDGSNSYEKFIEVFQKGGVYHLLNADFMHGLSLYIDDMRLLKNIYNEFMIYYLEFQKASTEQDINKILAMVTYKNVFPKDFGELQLNRGYVYTIFSKKLDFVDEEIKRIDDSIEGLNKEIRKIDLEVAQQIDELDAIYFFDSRDIRKGNKEYTSRVEMVHDIKENEYDIRYVKPGYAGIYSANVKETFEKMRKLPEYIEREQRIGKRGKANQRKISNQIFLLEYKKKKLKNADLKEIINNQNKNIIFSISFESEYGTNSDDFEEIKNSPYLDLIIYLLQEGYIDETYADYMTYFYGNSINQQDKIFLRSLTDHNPKEYAYKLSNPMLVIRRMRSFDFETDECLNYSLLDELLERPDCYDEERKKFLHLFENYEPVEFIEGYMSRGRNIFALVEKMNLSWECGADIILASNAISEYSKRIYALATVCTCEKTFVEKVNINECISNYINNDADFICLSNDVLKEYGTDIEKITVGLGNFDVKFKSVHVEGINKELFEAVYNSYLYELNTEMIALILKEEYGIKNEFEINNRTYTCIMSQDQPLLEYTLNNLSEFLNNVCDSGEAIYDDTQAVLSILNHSTLNFEKKKRYIERLKIRLPLIKEVKDQDIWTILIPNNIEITQENIFDYFYDYLSGRELDSNLVEFINDSPENIEFIADDLDTVYGEKAKSNWFWAIIKTNDIRNLLYKKILLNTHLWTNSYDMRGLESEKAHILVDNKIIRMSESQLTAIRERFEEEIPLFIKNNIKKYCEIMTDALYLTDEMIFILEMDVDEEDMLQILDFEPGKVSIRGKNYSENILLHILVHNFDVNDKPWLYANYDQYSVSVQNKIYKIARDNTEEIIESELQLNYFLCYNLMKLDAVDLADRKKILAISCKIFSREEIVKCLTILGLSQYLDLLNGKRPLFEMTESNGALLQALKERKLISDFHVDKKNDEYYRGYGLRKNSIKED